MPAGMEAFRVADRVLNEMQEKGEVVRGWAVRCCSWITALFAFRWEVANGNLRICRSRLFVVLHYGLTRWELDIKGTPWIPNNSQCYKLALSDYPWPKNNPSIFQSCQRHKCISISVSNISGQGHIVLFLSIWHRRLRRNTSQANQ